MKRCIALAILWVACGYMNYGLTLGHGTHRYPDQSNVGFAVFMGVGGPFAVPAVLVTCSPYHWRTVPLTTEQRWQEFHKSAPDLSREYFEQHYN
jgi:hypothetical protein